MIDSVCCLLISHNNLPEISSGELQLHNRLLSNILATRECIAIMSLHQIEMGYKNNKNSHNSIYCIVKNGMDMEMDDCIPALVLPLTGSKWVP